MSECMTIDVFAAEEKYADPDLTASNDIVQSILSETLHSVVGTSEQEFIGDCNVAEDGKEPYEASRTDEDKKSCEYVDAGKKELTLEDSELRLNNGKTHLESDASEKVESNCTRDLHQDTVREENSDLVDNPPKSAKDNLEALNLNVVSEEQGKGNAAAESLAMQGQEARSERPFIPFTTEDLRQSLLQVWNNVNSSVLNGWEGELTNQPQEVIRLMEELSQLHVTPNAQVDRNRPRACTLVDDEIKKMIKEIEKMNFKNSSNAPEEAADTPAEGIKNSEKAVSQKREEEISDDKMPDNQGNESLSQDYGFAAETVIGESENYRCQEPEIEISSDPASISAHKSYKFNDAFDFETSGAMFTMTLTEPDEALIELSESVIQIIEPQEDSGDENEEGKVSFSLLRESDRTKYSKEGEEYDSLSTEIKEGGEEEVFRKICSGMTTVGPIKNVNYNPKMLTGQEVDFGRMTKISGSQELRKDNCSDSLHSSSSSRKIYLEDNDDSPIIFFENGYMEFDTIVNHDIASLTKVQKVKEVLSDQTRSDEDFHDEEKLMRPPLDLKDVDAESNDSYNVIDIGIPLLTVEERTCDSTKDFSSNIQIILNGSSFRTAGIPATAEVIDQAPGSAESKPSEGTVDDGKAEPQDAKDEVATVESPQEKSPEKPLITEKIDEYPQLSSSFSCNKSVTQIPSGQKHNTISRVFQKASNKFIMKDSDSFLRNSKSLPRDTNKIANTESFKSLLDDCQSSAASVLKKSRSFLRNTQNVFKAVSKTGFNHEVSGDKQGNPGSEANVEQTESRQSTSSRKMEFSKFKDAIKSKVGKTLKSLENITSPDIRGMANERQEIKLISKNETEIRSEPLESFKKLPPKSPLVCANNLPQSQSCEIRKVEFEGQDGLTQGLDVPAGNSQAVNYAIISNDNAVSVGSTAGGEMDVIIPDKEIEVLCDVKFPGKYPNTDPTAFSNSVPEEPNDTNSDQIDFIVMETIHDVSQYQTDIITPVMDDRSQSEPNETISRINSDSVEVPKAQELPTSNSFLRNSGEVPKSFTLPLDAGLQDDVFDEFIGNDGRELQKSLSNGKLSRKEKKFSARIRRFWQTAFRKVKATNQKKDVS